MTSDSRHCTTGIVNLWVAHCEVVRLELQVFGLTTDSKELATVYLLTIQTVYYFGIVINNYYFYFIALGILQLNFVCSLSCPTAL